MGNILDIISKINYYKIILRMMRINIGYFQALKVIAERDRDWWNEYMFNFMIILEFFSIGLILIALLLLLNGDGAHEQKLLIFCMCSSLVQNVGYLLELTSPTLEAAVTAVTVENVGSAFVALSYCWFIYNYCYAVPPKSLLRFLGVFNTFLLPTVIFNWNGVFYRDIQWMTAEEGFHYIHVTYGPLYTVFMISRIVIPFVLCIYTLGRAIYLRSDQEVNRQYKTILVISLLPVLVLTTYVFKLAKIFDFTPMTLGISMSTVVILIWSRRNYDFRHLAAEKVLESLGDGVMALDDHDRLVSYNKAAAKIFPHLPSHKMGENVRVLEDFREEMLEKDTPQRFSLNNRQYESHNKLITDEYGRTQGCVILILDTTETTAYINEIKRVRQQAEKASIAKSEFLANMSHEIRTPMNAIIGLNDIIMEKCGDSQIFDHAKDVQSAAKNLLTIINDILDLSKVEAGKMELVPTNYHLKTLVNEVAGMMDMAASQRGLILKCECDDSLPCCYWGDEGRIKQILINILNNAIKFTKEGYVHASVTGTPGENPDEEFITFRVQDSGCGIQEQDLDKIFEDFKQVDSKRNRSVEGTGLGLSIVRHLVELMNGKITVESVYGKGTVFKITIPQKITDMRPISQMPSLPARNQDIVETFTAPDVKVLVVDDNVINRKVARCFLDSYNFDLTEADSGQKAIELVKNTRYDIIFMDHMMPMMDGIEATEIIRRDCGENGTSPAIIALTANAMEGMRERFLECGFQDFIPKPLERKELNQLLMRWIPEERRQFGNDPKPENNAVKSPPLNPNSFRIEGVDLNAAMEYFSGDEAAFIELLELYYTDGIRKIGLLHGFSQSDLTRYQVEVHGLKSASANIGAMEVSALARNQENAAAQGDTEFITEGLPGLLAEYERLLENIGDFLTRRQENIPKEQKLPCPSSLELQEQTDKALNLLEDFQSRECTKIVENMLHYALPKDVEDSLKQIQTQLKLFEDDEAEELLRQLSGRLGKENS